MKSEKKPDLVVWSEERNYYARELEYGSNLSAPSIRADNVDGWKRARVEDFNREFKARYDELVEQAKRLKSEYEWNELLYTRVHYSFQPMAGRTYHLYSRRDGTMFLSIVEPGQWRMDHVGSFKMDSSGRWIKI